jgi:crotonobetainyl-CoA:carnitine CoA-transferase CaiB-like acyl-CoA transferase
VLGRWGLDRTSMAAVNPGLSVVSMGGLGQGGPWSNFVTYAPTIHALVGLTYLTNPPGRHDVGYGFSLTDHLSGLAGALAALEAIEHRDRTGTGLEIDLAQYELGLGLMAPALLDYIANGVNPDPVGNRHPFNAWAPHGIYRCSGDDDWVAIAARGDEQWRALCDVSGRTELAADPRFSTQTARIANQDALDIAMNDWTRSLDRYEVMALCQAAGVAAGAVQNARDLAENDRQLADRRFFGTATSEGRGNYPIDCFPARFNGHRPDTYAGVRELGADTFDVISDLLGLSADEIAELAAANVLS